MSGSNEGNRIVCRQCGDTVDIAVGNCPHCGTSVRSSWKMIGAIGFGILIIAVSLFGALARGEGDLWFFAGLGVLISVIAGLFYHDRRSRIQQASEIDAAEAAEEEDADEEASAPSA